MKTSIARKLESQFERKSRWTKKGYFRIGVGKLSYHTKLSGCLLPSFAFKMGAQKGLPSKAVLTPIKARTLDAENPLLGIDFIITSSVGRERRGHISLVRLSYVPNFDYPRPGILHSSHMPYSVRWREQEPKLWDRRKSSAQRLITVSAWAGSGYDWSLLRHIAYWFPLLAFLSTSCLSPLCTPPAAIFGGCPLSLKGGQTNPLSQPFRLNKVTKLVTSPLFLTRPY